VYAYEWLWAQDLNWSSCIWAVKEHFHDPARDSRIRISAYKM